jgi:hypothetical protein
MFTDLADVWKYIESRPRHLASNPIDGIQSFDYEIPPFLEGLHHMKDRIPAEGRFEGDAGSLLIVGRNARKIVDIEILEDLGFLYGGEEGPADSAAGPRKTLGDPAHQDADLLHPRTGDDAVMLHSVKQDVFIYLVREDDLLDIFSESPLRSLSCSWEATPCRV